MQFDDVYFYSFAVNVVFGLKGKKQQPTRRYNIEQKLKYIKKILI